jgi:anti-anti-sigma factor
MPALTISRSDFPAHTVLSVAGEIDICTAPALRTSLQDVPLKDLILDLSDVGFFGAIGLHLVDDVQARLHDAHRQLMIVESPQVRLVIGLLCVDLSPRTVRVRASTVSAGQVGAKRHEIHQGQGAS